MEVQALFEALIKYCYTQKYPDIHLSSHSYPLIRNRSGDIETLTEIVDEAWVKLELEPLKGVDVEHIARYILSPDKYLEYVDNLEVDSSYTYAGNNRYRVNCFTNIRGKAIAMRQIPHEIPSLEVLWLWETIKTMCSRQKWLILMTWPTGSGKSTNLAAMIDFINENFKKHIISIEDPVEFVYNDKQSLIHQREVGIHTKSFSQAMKSCLREDPDVILIWEMRDPETIRSALTLAETWHLVLSTLHTNDTVQTIDRIVDVFPEGQQEQVRMQLALSLIGVIAQRLLPRNDREGRIPSREILLNNDAVRNLIITWNTHQLYSVIEIEQKSGMILMDNYLVVLYKKWIISEATLKSYLRDKDNLKVLLS